LPPEKLILWAHPPLLGLWGPAAEAEWTRFLRTLGPIFPVPLPAQLGNTRFFSFTSRWEPVPVAGGGDDPQRAALQAVLAAKGLRKLPSRSWVAIWEAAKRIWLFVFFAGMAILILDQLFRRR
jgi:hypothetical protein